MGAGAGASSTGESVAVAARLGAAPNPFNARTRIRLEAGGPDRTVRVEIFDLRGRSVASVPLALRAGRGEATWDGRSHSGGDLPSGVYLYRAAIAGDAATGRITLVK